MVASLLTLFLQGPPDIARERSLLTEGVTSLTAPGAVPGPMIASGPKTFVVATGENGRVPLFVAGHIGSGRVLAGGHESFFSGGSLKSEGNNRFLLNAITWLSGRSPRGVKVGALDMPGIGEVVGQFSAVPMAVNRQNLAQNIPYLDVICMTQGALDGDAAAQAAVVKFVKEGHGLLIAGPAWGWQSLHGDRDLRTDHAGNRMLLPYGLGFASGSIDGPFGPTGAESPLLQADTALEALKKGGLKPKEITSATDSIQRALELLPADNGLAATIAKFAASEGGEGGPTAQKPITNAMPFSRLEIGVEAREIEKRKPEEVRAHPSSAYFPGAIPANARRVTRTISVDSSIPNWHSTGLYAAAGEVVTITVPKAMSDVGLSVRIGTHTDELWRLDRWERFPAISRAWRIRQETTKVASPFGGLIYIDVPDRGVSGLIPATIEHAATAPWFVRGKTTKAEWQAMLADPGAPWAEIQCDLVILTVPRSAAATITDPDALAAYWDEVMSNCYELYAAPRRRRQERYCVDHQISAGYMHSGYPIMTFEDVANTFCDVTKLRSKGGPTWGFYHEMGHNFQQGDWTFGGTGEVTNNLFSLYGAEKMNAATPDTYGMAHPNMQPATVQKRLEKYVADGAKFSEWQNEPFLALSMYAQLREGFGWEPFTKVFGEYQGLAQNEHPRNDLEKHDQWMIRFSKAVGKNLAPFFDAWGMPISDSARKATASMPAWMPKDWPGTKK